MHLGSPANLWFLILAEGVAVGFVLLALWRRRAATRFAGERVVSSTPSAYWVRATLVVIAATLAVVAMARPQWGSREFSRDQEGVDIVIALDVSQSMIARDIQPSRLAAAQADLGQLLDGLRGHRVGLVFFAGTAILRSPLSTDTEALAQIIRRADREPGLTRAGSDLGAALDQAGRILAASESPGKAVIIVSDGEDHAGAAVQKAQELAGQGVLVYTAGVGTPEGATILEPVGAGGQTRTKLDAQGRPVITRLDEGNLRGIASAGGGSYVRLRGNPGLSSLRDEVNRLERTPLSEQTQRVPIERLQIFVGAALAALALAWLVPERLPRLSLPRLRTLRPRPGLALLVVALLTGACAEEDAIRLRNQEANDLYASGQLEQALGAYAQLLAERPDLPEIAYNTGNTLHRLGDYARAVQETRRALPPTTAGLGAATFYALGNHYLAQGDLPNAYQAYRNALLLDPQDRDAKYNLELTLLQLNEEDMPPGQQPAGGEPGQEMPQGEQGGDPQPGQGAPAGEPTGEPQPGAAPGESAADVQRALEEALSGLDESFTFEEAIEVLELLQRLREQRPTPAQTSPGGLDY